MKRFGYKQSQVDHTRLIKNYSQGKVTGLLVYVDDVVLTRNDNEKIVLKKINLGSEFCIKD
jgi:hypothetical protein